MSVESMYRGHHESRDRIGYTVLGDERGAFLRREIGTGKRVLDIGCRDGELTQTYCNGNDVVGVDIDSDALQRAKKRLGIETAHFDLHEKWPLEDRSFDAVVAGEVLEHLFYPERIVGKIANVLRDDGALVGSVPNAFSLANRVRLLFGNKRYTPLHDPTHITHFSRSELIAMLQRYFSIVSITPLGRFAAFDRFFPGLFAFDLLFSARKPKR